MISIKAFLMAGDSDKKIEFTDESITAAQNAAGSAGRSNFEKQKEIFDRINAGLDTGKSAAVEPSPQVSGVVIKSLRTFQGDVAEAIKNQHASVVTIAVAEQEKKAREENTKTEQPYEPPKNEVERIVGKKYIPPIIQKTEEPQIKPVQNVKPQPTVASIDPGSVSPPPIFKERAVIVEKKKIDPDVIKNTLTIVASVVLIILGVGALIGFYILQKKAPTITPPAPVDQTIVAFNTKETIDAMHLNRDDLINSLINIRTSSKGNDNEITYIALTKKVDSGIVSINTVDLFQILNTTIPGVALRAMGSQFMFGIYHLQNTNSPFLIIKLTSFNNAFAGMLTWEKTLNKDLGSIFSARSIPITAYNAQGYANGAITPSSTTTQVVSTDRDTTQNFKDITILNKDARILKNSKGEEIMLYSFLDENTLLITSNQSVFHEILNKYLLGKLVR